MKMRLAGWLLIAMPWLGTAIVVEAEQAPAIEEVTVTGSYIKRDNYDLASPISVIDSVDIEQASTLNTADILWGQTYNVGTQIIATPHNADIGGQGGESAQAAVGFANIRGLGADATLSLMDGRRLPFGDANFNYPQIAIQRIETLLDGASALYGTQAIAGVINYIPRKTFEGFKIRYERSDLLDVSSPDEKLGIMFGANGDRARAMFALEYRQRERVEQYNFPEFKAGCRDDLNDPGTGNCFDTAIRDRVPRQGFPGGALRTVRDAMGDLVTTGTGDLVAQKRPSPGCGHTFMVPTDANGNPIQAANPNFGFIGRGVDDPTVAYNNRWGIPHPNGRDCGMSMSYMLDYQGEIPAYIHGYSRFEFDLSDDMTLWADLMFGKRNVNTRAWPSPHVAQTEPLTVPGDHPGNPMRAFADVDGDARYDAADGDQFLYAQDNCDFNGCNGPDGLPDRGVDGNGDGIADDLNGDGIPDVVPREQSQWGNPVLLAGVAGQDSDGDGIEDRFDPDAGIPFANDITLERWTPFSYGHVQGLPSYVQDGGWALRDREERNLRLAGGVEFAIPNTAWETELSFVWGERQKDYAEAWGSTYNSSFGNMLGRINCLRNANGVTPRGVEGDCIPFNPFITSQFPIVDYVPQNELTPEFIQHPNDPTAMIPNPAFNTPEMVEGVMTENKDRSINTIKLVDFILRGPLFELPYAASGGAVGLAVGAQFRDEGEDFLPNQINETNTNLYGTGFPRRSSHERAVDAFAELVLPVLDHAKIGYVELQLAGRHTDVEYEASIGNTSVKPSFSRFVPKYAVLYQPNDWMSLRASYSEGFVTPNQNQVVGTQRQADRAAQDPTCQVLETAYNIVLDADTGYPNSGCTYDLGAGGDKTVVGEEAIDFIGANPGLGPQTSRATSAGVSFRLLQGDLSIDLNYIDIEFLGEIRDILIRDRVPIEQERFNLALVADCGNAPTADCANTFRQSWITTAGLETDAFVRGSQYGPIIEHYGGPANTTGRFVTAYDVQTRYRFSANQLPVIGGNWGAFVATLNATFNEKFQYHNSADAPLREGAGDRNDCCQRQPMPKIRMNGSLAYMYGDHVARLAFTWHDEVDDLTVAGAIPFSNKDGKIESQAVFSLYYQYALNWRPSSAPLLASVSVSNLFGSRPKALVDSSGFDPILSGNSALGRMVTFRIEQAF